MLQVARLSPRLLGESAESVRAFVDAELGEDGFADRDGKPDLYYTVFGLDCLAALQAELPRDRVRPGLARWGAGEALDLVHLACLVRAWAALGEMPSAVHDALPGRLTQLRSADGGWAPATNAAAGTVYASFLAVGALQDAKLPVPEPERLAGFLRRALGEDGGVPMAPGVGAATTPTTAAAVALMRQVGVPVPATSALWLAARAAPSGGFVAAPGTPVPDLLSTAVALHALAGMQAPIDAFREPCLDFIDTLWTAKGAFFGHWAETTLDCEYTFYGLLALGHLCL